MTAPGPVIEGNSFEITFEASIDVHHDEEKYQAWLAAQAADDEKE